MAETKLIRDHHLWTRDTIKNVSGSLTIDIADDLILDSHTGITHFRDGGDADDAFKITVVGGTGATTLETVSDAADGHLTLDPDGDLLISAADVKIDATKKLYFDGGGNTYFAEGAADRLDLYIGGVNLLQFQEHSSGELVHFLDTAAGFTQFEPTYNASDTDVEFNQNGNKGFVTFGSGNITDLNLTFPSASGNFTLVLKQDGTGSRTVTNYKAFDSTGSAASGSSTVKFAGGSNPTLTTDANHVDIISFYWDADNGIAYGVASLDFQF